MKSVAKTMHHCLPTTLEGKWSRKKSKRLCITALPKGRAPSKMYQKDSTSLNSPVPSWILLNISYFPAQDFIARTLPISYPIMDKREAVTRRNSINPINTCSPWGQDNLHFYLIYIITHLVEIQRPCFSVA